MIGTEVPAMPPTDDTVRHGPGPESVGLCGMALN